MYFKAHGFLRGNRVFINSKPFPILKLDIR